MKSASLLALITIAATWVWAHEGHAPLPSKGADVDVARGTIVLTHESRTALDVLTADVEDGPLPDHVLAYATLAAPWQQHAFASSRLPGRIATIAVKSGQRVLAGEVLAEIQSLELESLQLELLNSQNDIRVAQGMLAMLNESPGTVRGQEILDAQSKLQQHRNVLLVASIKWNSLGLSASDLEALLRDGRPKRDMTLPVRSLVGGTVIHADLTVGKVVEPGEHLFEVIDPSKVWAKIGVLERDLQRVNVGQQVELQLTAYGGEKFRSTVRVKGLALDAQTGLNTVWAEFENPAGKEPRLLPGMSGQARIALPPPAGVRTIPSSALIRDGVENYVLLETANAEKASEYLKVPVIVRRRTTERAEVQAGSLFPGTRVVTQGGHELGEFFQAGVLRPSRQMATTIGLKVEPIRPQVVENIVETEGMVEILPDRRAFASSHLGGNLASIGVDVGQPVKKGQILAEIVGMELQSLQLDLLREQLSFQLVEQQYQELKKVDQASARRRLLEVEGEFNAVRNRRDSTRRRLEVVGLDDRQIDGILTRREIVPAVPVRSPVDGFVVHFDKTLGQAVKAEEPLFEVHDLSRPLVQAFLPERDLARVRIGQAARIRLAADPGAIHLGHVVRSGRVFDDGQTLSVWVELDRSPDGGLRHNQFARVTFTVDRPAPTLALPTTAVIHDGTQAFAFVRIPFSGPAAVAGLVARLGAGPLAPSFTLPMVWVAESVNPVGAVYERRAVQIGRSDDRLVEVRDGLFLGETVAVSGSPALWTAFSSLR